MFLRILGKSFMNRKGKIAIAVFAVIMGVSIPSAMMTVSLDVTEKVQTEFRKFGANLLVVPKSDSIDVGIGDINLVSVTDQRYINETDIYKIKTISWGKNILGYAPFLYQVVDVEANGQEQRVVLAGTWFDKNTVLDDGTEFITGVRKINNWWNVDGSWVNDGNVTPSGSSVPSTAEKENCMIGATVAEKLGLEVGDSFTVTYRMTEEVESGNSSHFTVVGIITTGSSEDNQIFVPLSTAQNLTNRVDKVHTVQVSALCTGCPIDTIAEEIEGKITYAEARSILQVTITEMSILSTIEQMMLLITLVVLLATVLGVSTTMTTSIIERQTEIGLMKSIGAENRKILLLFLSEAAAIGALGGVTGYLVGIVLAQFVGMSVFGSTVSLQLSVLPPIIAISISFTLLASFLPARRAMMIEPAIVLRGE
ncbi:MAG: ABC transporter permease [Candidatus Odinarchaeota archaeon]